MPVARRAREQLEHQRGSVIGFLDDHELDELLDCRGRALRRPARAGASTCTKSTRALIARHGCIVGTVVGQASRHAVACQWWSGTVVGEALSEADAVARVAANSE